MEPFDCPVCWPERSRRTLILIATCYNCGSAAAARRSNRGMPSRPASPKLGQTLINTLKLTVNLDT
ncbi:hypothetical protein F441_14395 [Phytophthora nicotianae CJ01A1]|uniref:Uncharacterized protein n=6 Tax=Phytophthora nicotianae TaxID=4792 RepID=V9EL65_PHYNI|nr:hypothetical protein F443_14520 [Phytophthora nicotianae P1569]ETK80059.1 hypothetical protein L915_14165 [Phytophthora nicotianae]ETO68674.1 hypothetical protein F444_14533 [Phytophthora nicotianae P1976]ETP09801.1 hypothetical protein F441_14395 [Phytophthora nicotianae CJ01A1]ETL33481.1 hypothetical protein L916_14063 [Phytophthora nicotianae]